MSDLEWLVSMIAVDRQIYHQALNRVYSKTRNWDEEIIATHPYREALRMRLAYALLNNEDTTSYRKDIDTYENNIRLMMKRRIRIVVQE